jgi:excinuclease UvrABC ATPase subunit
MRLFIFVIFRSCLKQVLSPVLKSITSSVGACKACRENAFEINFKMDRIFRNKNHTRRQGDQIVWIFAIWLSI